MNEVFAFAEAQYGVFTRAQALERGCTDRQIAGMLANGRIERLFPGVYRVVGAFRSARQRALAACLYAGDSAMVSHATAGALLRLDGIRSRSVHVSVLHAVRRSSGLLTLHRTVDLPETDCVVVDGIPCTNGTRSILDLAGVVDAERLATASR
jgi:hypothetical protein